MLPKLAFAATALALLVPVGDGRRLDLTCTGSGSPTVVFESGLGVESRTWSQVQKRVSATTRACAYDRAGLGRSDRGADGRTARDLVDELHVLLANAEVDPPYVLVGASFGGLVSQLYSTQYPDEVAGIVLVDSLHPEFDARIEKLLTQAARRTRREELGLNRERIFFPQIVASEREAGAALPLPAVPLTVIRHGRPFSTAKGWPSRKVEALWLRLQQELAAEGSPPGRLVLAARSGHRIAEDQPALVASEIVRIVSQVR